MVTVDCDWSTTSGVHHLDRVSIYVWRGQMQFAKNYLGAYKSFLSKEEKEVSEKFVRLTDRDRFIFAHGMLRKVLSQFVNCHPAQLVFTHNSFGKPSIASPERGQRIKFNLSHSRDIVLSALSIDHAVGIDVEYMRKMDNARQIAKQNFSKVELEYLCSMPPHEFRTTFYKYWTLKESFIKAIGKGLSYPLDQFSVLLQDAIPPQIPIRTQQSLNTKEQWIGYLLKPEINYAAAVTAQAHIQYIRLFQFLP